MDRVPDFYQLDESWYRYMKADRKERKKMCEDNLEVINIVYGIGIICVVFGVILVLCKGWV